MKNGWDSTRKHGGFPEMGVPFLHSFLWFISWFSSKKWGFYGTPIDWTTYGDFLWWFHGGFKREKWSHLVRCFPQQNWPDWYRIIKISMFDERAKQILWWRNIWFFIQLECLFPFQASITVHFYKTFLLLISLSSLELRHPAGLRGNVLNVVQRGVLYSNVRSNDSYISWFISCVSSVTMV